MKKLKVKARAKINLTLDVLGKRPDGYHEVEMVMQTIELHDLLLLEEADRGVVVTTSNPLLAAGESNIAYKAARLVMDALGVEKGIRIHIIKNIPVAAGLAGGSTDAAAVLKGLNSLWDLGLSKDEAEKMGASIGSDVPFCVRGGTALARGRGEILSNLPDAPEMWLVLAKPPLEVSTAEVYQNFDPARVKRRPDTKHMLESIHNGNKAEVIENLANVLETVTFTRYPEVLQLKRVMEESGLRRTLMSGSGPTVFGVADSRAAAEGTARRLRDKLPGMFVAVSRTWPTEWQEFQGKG